MKTNKKLFLIITLSIISFFNFQLFAEENNPVTYNGTTFSVTEINPFDRILMNPYSKPLDYTATGLEVMTLLTPSVMFMAPVQDYWKIGVEYGETLILAYGAKELAKHLVDRARPYMYFEGAPSERIADGDWKDSFFSGHTTMTFAAASFTTVMVCQYFPDAEWKTAVIIGSYIMAATTATARLFSGNHFLTDVLMGALVGSAIGVGVPLLNSLWFKPSRIGNTDVAMSPLGFSLSFKL